jgi:aminopeptidase N
MFFLAQVTMEWWTDLWLKEGFASFMEYQFVGSQMPEFRIWEKFLTAEMERGFHLDSLRNTHSIEVSTVNRACTSTATTEDIKYI